LQGRENSELKYSVIIPVFCEAESLEEICIRNWEVFQGLKEENTFELIFVDDGSTDDSINVLKRLCEQHVFMRAILLRKNQGKSMALTTGFRAAKGSYIITMDGDLQDQPEEIPRLISKMQEGYELVCGWKQKRYDSKFRVFGSKVFNYIVSYFGKLKLHDYNCGLKLYKKNLTERLFVYGQYHRYIPLIAHLQGFSVCEIPVKHKQRKYGVSKYPAFRYQGSFDLFSILFIYKYKFTPLYFFGILGFSLIIPSLLIIAWLVSQHLLFLLGIVSVGQLLTRPLLILSVTLTIAGLNIFLTGFVCDFILHHQIKNNISQFIELNIEMEL